jgi:predicted glycosyltransferase
VVAVLSGIETQRSALERQLTDRFQSADFQTLIVCGKPTKNMNWSKIGNVHLVSHLTTLQMANYLRGAKKIISRSGYSTIMDLDALNCLHKAELIPTPGQTEQEYLASFHSF